MSRFLHLTGMNHTRIVITSVTLVVALVAAVAFVMHGSSRAASVQVLSASGHPTPTASQNSTPTASPSSVPSNEPIKVPAQLTGFVCGSSTLSGAQPTGSALIDALRVGSHTGYDRFVVEFSSAAPGHITLTPQANATFMNSPRGDSVTLAGKAGLLVRMNVADAHTKYSGALTFKPNGTGLVEIRRVEDFEGYVAFGLGIGQGSCYRAFLVSSPTRLVIDVQAA